MLNWLGQPKPTTAKQIVSLEPGWPYPNGVHAYGDVLKSLMASKITSLKIVYSTVYSGADQRHHQSSASLAYVRGIHRWPMNSLWHIGPVTRKMFPFDDVIMPRQQAGWSNFDPTLGQQCRHWSNNGSTLSAVRNMCKYWNHDNE